VGQLGHVADIIVLEALGVGARLVRVIRVAGIVIPRLGFASGILPAGRFFEPVDGVVLKDALEVV
jgi:hypothetical protein